jgi:Arc/MetJ-type ribon-helix-helix transcriptional regulator
VTTQIAVRLPDDMVEFLDRMVALGEASSRASVVERALAREFRRIVAVRDAAILAEAAEAAAQQEGGEPGPDARPASADPDLDRLAEYAAQHPLDLE